MAARHRDAKLLQQFLRLIFVDVHRIPPLLTIGWTGAVRPSRRPLWGLLRMSDSSDAIEGIPHAEERRRRVSKHARCRCSLLAPHVFDDFDQFTHRADRFVERGLLLAVQRDFDNALDTASA